MKFFFTKIRHVLEMIKFSHSIFALPFALASLVVASGGRPDPIVVALVILCMVFARNVAMSFNRLVDAKIDAKNPRTQSRHIPQGLLSKKFVALFILCNAGAFVGTTYFINPQCFFLSPVALGIICFYSYTKRWTSYAQLFLGLSLAVAPIGAWLAVAGTLSLFPLSLGLAVLFWVAGFDIIYAIQDVEFDKKTALHSLVTRFGITGSLMLARIFHILCLLTLLFLGIHEHFTWGYFGSVSLMASLFAYEHSLVTPHDQSRINAAFFTVNGWIGIIFFAGVLTDVLLIR